MQLFISLLLLTLFSFVGYSLLKALIIKELSNPKHLDTLLSTLDDTVYNHVTLIEEQTRELEAAMERAKRLLTLLEKEEKNFSTIKELNSPILKSKNPFHAVMNIEKASSFAELSSLEAVKVELSEEIYKKPLGNFTIKKSSDEKSDINKEVLALFREGKETDEIASILAIPQARIELITSMHLSKNKPQS